MGLLQSIYKVILFILKISFKINNKHYLIKISFIYLFFHHVKDVRDLDWGTRMKIGMGICYCLQHMHNLKPPIPHSNVNSGVVYLTEEFTAKVSH